MILKYIAMMTDGNIMSMWDHDATTDCKINFMEVYNVNLLRREN